MRIINAIKYKTRMKLRSFYLARKRRKFRNKSVSIICNNCVGGSIYHDLNCRFNSPTINLDIKQEDFPFFVLHLREYLSLKIIPLNRESEYPVGQFDTSSCPTLKPINIFFIHYKSFNDAIISWEERKKRVDFNNLRIIFDITSRLELDESVIEEFSKVKYKKIVFSSKKYDLDALYKIDFKKRTFKNGWILHYYHFYKRFYDQFDYVRFLN